MFLGEGPCEIGRLPQGDKVGIGGGFRGGKAGIDRSGQEFQGVGGESGFPGFLRVNGEGARGIVEMIGRGALQEPLDVVDGGSLALPRP
jgi:hypothetical protein